MPMPPCPFPPSKLAPSQSELDWLYDWLISNNIMAAGIIEFGCGVTTWALYHGALDTGLDQKSYLCFEDYQPCVDAIRKFLTCVDIQTEWKHIKWNQADLVFVDSSCGCGKPGLHREDCVKAVEDHQSDGDILIIHDWRKKSGRKARAYLESCGKYELIDSFDGRTGLGIYRRKG